MQKLDNADSGVLSTATAKVSFDCTGSTQNMWACMLPMPKPYQNQS